MCTLNASNDYEAVQAWLSLHEAEATRRAYRKEAERLMLWAIVERQRALSSLTTDDAIGSRDPARTFSHAESLSNGISGSRLVVLETGHTSCVEAPDEFAEVIRYVVEQGLGVGTGSAD
ncbi:Integrase [Caballeronia sordidicola]|uniref:Integrase n=1 Tax=Caballeronia sordidicola TaxID=196367 RepID=A0A226WUA0_CABSO|nr:Integrase [Caballeronia sordidicola]